MTNPSPCILHVVLAIHVYKYFDYLPPDGYLLETISTCQRVLVPFKNSTRIGLIYRISKKSSLPHAKLKKTIAIIDPKPIFSHKHLKILAWISAYYHQPIGEVVFGSLPPSLRKYDAISKHFFYAWSLSKNHGYYAKQIDKTTDKKIISILKEQSAPLSYTEIARKISSRNLSKALDEMQCKEWITKHHIATTTINQVAHYKTPILSERQKIAFQSVNLKNFGVYLLHGVTGSGKTAVYQELISQTLQSKKQILLLIPEITLIPQMVNRIQEHFQLPISLLHSGSTPKKRLLDWIDATTGKNAIIIGTRSAALVPLFDVGMIIVDEEHDSSYHQQEGFRYSARDVAIMRSCQNACPTVLGSATPALESWHNTQIKKSTLISLPNRYGASIFPNIKIIDIKQTSMQGPLSDPLINAIQATLEKQQQILLFLNRRGYAPILICHDCGEYFLCAHCNTAITLHKRKKRMHCHHCNHRHSIPTQCVQCQSKNLREIGYGTERIVEVLQDLFSSVRVARLDRDAVSNQKNLLNTLTQFRNQEIDILVGTQMTAKGHDFPNLTLVGVIDADQGMYLQDFRATERMGQMLFQVCGRAGRGGAPGNVLIQTHHPNHPTWSALTKHDYPQLVESLLQERKEAHLPPFINIAVISARSKDEQSCLIFLKKLSKEIIGDMDQNELTLLGPIAAPIEKRAGYFRMQLILQSEKRKRLHAVLSKITEQEAIFMKTKTVRWNIEVDPVDLL